ncbi:MAG: septum formation inhibitor Maf [Gammaproteobacteria bacterium SG8_11]|nr:MAG: septum formation inhibitor Maf [Gammaproteobacteria bacterium SG8_11]
MQLILASTSPYRQTVLKKLPLAFETDSPDIDESRLPNENPEDLVKRLAEAKARAVMNRHPHSLIIGSDQVAVLNGEILGKPGDHDNAVIQLRKSSGKQVVFHTGLCLLNSDTQNTQISCVPFMVQFRLLSEAQIERYLKHEKPYNSAGSFKSEGLGITLFEKLQGDDPNTLIGLPLIELVRMLENEGIILP